MKYIIFTTIFIFLSGCSLFEKREDSKPIIIEHRTSNIKVFHPPLPSGAELISPVWKVWTPKIMEQYLKDLKAGSAPTVVIYGLSKNGYEDLSNDMAELTRVIKGYRGLIIYYRTNVNEVAAPEVDKVISNETK